MELQATLQTAKEKAEGLKQEGNDAYRREDFKTAIHKYQQAANAIEDCFRSTLYSSKGTVPDMLAFLTTLEACRPDLSIIYSNMTQAYLDSGSYHVGLALTASRSALWWDPSNPEAWFRFAAAMESDWGCLLFSGAAAVAACGRCLHVLDETQDQLLTDLARRLLAECKDMPSQKFKVPAVIALCASHITNELRYLQLQAMLRSWAAQDHPVPLYLSISFSPAEFTPERQQQLAAELEATYGGLKVVLQAAQQSHLGSALQTLDDPPAGQQCGHQQHLGAVYR